MCKYVLALTTLSCAISSHVLAATIDEKWPDPEGPYLGQEPPGMVAEIFAPGIISTEESEINSAFSPDGTT